MNVDTSLGSNAVVYSLNYPNSLSDKIFGKRLNVSFGPYRVTNVDLSWTRTSSQAEDPDPLFTITDTHKSGNTTTTTKLGAGPTSFFGFSRPPAEGEPTIDKSFRTVKYRFTVGQEIIWNGHCVHRSEKRVIQHENSNTVEILLANFTCEYKEDNKRTENESSREAWTLSVEYGGAITMTQKGKINTLAAHSTGGNYVEPNGQPTKLSIRTAGYTWRQSEGGNDKNIAAISVREETPRVWLYTGNSDYLNHVLSMANTGLLIYRWEIEH
ncbi:MAG: hypothetical protein OEM02_05615 [Desulfobulbaceae bacterium]|nr:hypothetical protein [Desulfobulbaceae bacterium]